MTVPYINPDTDAFGITVVAAGSGWDPGGLLDYKTTLAINEETQYTITVVKKQHGIIAWLNNDASPTPCGPGS